MGMQADPARRRRGLLARYWWIGVLAAVAAGVVAGVWQPGARDVVPAGVGPAPAGTPPVARRETRPTLDPARFVGKAALAHQVAREIPDTLDQLYCYCECDKHMGHLNLLSCFTDSHGAT